MTMKLENKVAIVTGAGRNIGEEIARRFAAEGARVAVVDLDKARGAKGAGEINALHPHRALGGACDLSSSAGGGEKGPAGARKWGGGARLVENTAVTDRQN